MDNSVCEEIKLQSLGSCAVRGVKEKLNKINLTGNIGFNSIFSTISVKDDTLDEERFDYQNARLNTWESKMVRLDIEKQYFDYCKRYCGSYVCIDLIDERYDL